MSPVAVGCKKPDAVDSVVFLALCEWAPAGVKQCETVTVEELRGRSFVIWATGEAQVRYLLSCEELWMTSEGSIGVFIFPGEKLDVRVSIYGSFLMTVPRELKPSVPHMRIGLELARLNSELAQENCDLRAELERLKKSAAEASSVLDIKKIESECRKSADAVSAKRLERFRGFVWDKLGATLQGLWDISDSLESNFQSPTGVAHVGEKLKAVRKLWDEAYFLVDSDGFPRGDEEYVDVTEVVSKLVCDSRTDYQGSAEVGELDLSGLPAGTRPFVYGVPEMFQEAIKHVLENACESGKSGEEPPVKVSVALRCHDYDFVCPEKQKECGWGKSISILITDNGGGMDRDRMDNHSCWCSDKGIAHFGRGLVLFRMVVERMAGCYSVYTPAGGGTGVCICFPYYVNCAGRMIPQGDLSKWVARVFG